jgi:hypothetical protein
MIQDPCSSGAIRGFHGLVKVTGAVNVIVSVIIHTDSK